MTTLTTEQIHRALQWLVSLLNRHRVPYQVVGGLAAQAYGATRPLVDIDLYVPLATARAAVEEMRPFIVREPLPHKSASWDLVYLALEYDGVYFEIGDSATHPRFFNRIDQRWEPQVIDYSASSVVRLYGADVAVMPRDELVLYKTMLDREVDHADIEEMKAAADIPRLTYRSIHGEQDADALHAVRAGCIVRDQVDLRSTCEGLPSCDDIRAALAQAVAAHREHWWRVAEVSGRVVAYSRIDSWYEEDGRWVYLIFGWVLPAWRGRGIGNALLDWGEQTARVSAAAEHPGERFEFAANSNTTQPESTALLRDHGYHAGYTVLEMALEHAARQSPQPLPTGIELRLVCPEQIPAIAESIIRAYRDEYPGQRFMERWDIADSIASLSASRHDPTLWQVAWDGDSVAGQVLPLVERGRAEIYEVSVHPDYRRRGLARALLTRGIEAVCARGVEDVRLHTTAEFPTRARDLYASVGFRVVKEFPRYRKSA